jgi:hypothetical protein
MADMLSPWKDAQLAFISFKAFNKNNEILNISITPSTCFVVQK